MSRTPILLLLASCGTTTHDKATGTSDDASDEEDDASDTTDDTDPRAAWCVIDDAHRYGCCAFDRVNAWRAEQGEPTPYVWDARLAEVGLQYAGFMAEQQSFGHDLDGQTSGSRLTAAGIDWRSVGEILHFTSLSAWEDACVETVTGPTGWAESTDGHREAMLGQDPSGLDKAWTHGGAGVARSDGVWYVAMYVVRY